GGHLPLGLCAVCRVLSRREADLEPWHRLCADRAGRLLHLQGAAGIPPPLASCGQCAARTPPTATRLEGAPPRSMAPVSSKVSRLSLWTLPAAGSDTRSASPACARRGKGAPCPPSVA